MKRAVFVLALFCLATGASAIGMSAGLGASGAYYMTSGKYEGYGSSSDTLTRRVPFEFMAFFDMSYFQLAAGYRMFNSAHQKTTVKGAGAGTNEADYKQSAGFISLAGYGKYPFKLGAITLFPMIGVEYDLAIAATDLNGNDLTGSEKTDTNEFWFKGGVGADFSITPRLYLRPELIVGYKLLSRPEKDAISSLKDSGYSSVSILDLSFEVAVLVGLRL